MATRDATPGATRAPATPVGRSRLGETKASMMTTEFYAFIAAVAAILIAAWRAHNFEAPRAWTLVAAVVVGYMLSRGLAKSGSAHRDHDDDSY
jgi:hypothetical protein